MQETENHARTDVGGAVSVEAYRCDAPLFAPGTETAYGRCDTTLTTAVVINGITVRRHCSRPHVRELTR